MRIAIMQPYIFPFIGYFQLVYAADVFVFYDDVNFINKGWINRNRILVNNKDQLFTIPCKDASQNKLIKDIELLNDPKAMQKLLATIKMAYGKAPYFNDVYKLLEQTLSIAEGMTISQLAIRSIVNTCSYLGIQKTFKLSSETYTNQELKKGDRLIDICHIEGIPNYINAIGGKAIYTKEYFGEKGIDLSFLVPGCAEYPQLKGPFVPWLSMIDVLMFNSKEDITGNILPSFSLD